MADRITPKMARFAIEYCVDGNATQAAIRAGYSRHTAGSIGSENLAKPAIQALIEEQQRAAAEASTVTRDWVLLQARELATSATSEAARATALNLLARHLGMLTDRAVIEQVGAGAVQHRMPDYTDDQLSDELSRLELSAARVEVEPVQQHPAPPEVQ